MCMVPVRHHVCTINEETSYIYDLFEDLEQLHLVLILHADRGLAT